jgi:predicted glycoside hydrolase/deacetylase ChbG (UPF0249 family)
LGAYPVKQDLRRGVVIIFKLLLTKRKMIMKRNMILFIILIAAMQLFTHALAQEKSGESIRLIIRGDDLGSTQGTIEAFEQAINNGVLTCASIQVPAPWFEAAVEVARKHPGFCFGIHLTLVAEWRGYRWRPVLPYNEVPSLVDDDGYFYQSPGDLLAANPNADEIEAELAAQIELAQKRGIRISYLDNHYLDIDTIPGCNNLNQKLAAKYGLLVSGSVGEKKVKGIYFVPEEQKLEWAIGILEELKPGLWLWNCHPGIDSPEQNALIHTLPEDIFPGQGVGAHRAMVLEVLKNIAVKSIILRRGIILTDYNKIKE